MESAKARGRLTCIGLGMLLGGHLTPRSRAHLEQADVVFVAASDALVELWVQSIRPDARSLQPYYAEGKPRRQSYREMIAAMLAEVRAGRSVCAAFYGHPGVFAQVPHQAIEQARREGFSAAMEPGIGADACLYADLGIDPGRVGCQQFEATQFLLYQRRLDPTAYLVLWQVGVVGDAECRRYMGEPAHRRVLIDRLLADYPAEHGVIVYEAATLPIQSPRRDRMPLEALAQASLTMQSTLVVPPAADLVPDPATRALLTRLAGSADAEPTRPVTLQEPS